MSKKKNLKTEIYKILIEYDERYTVASVSILSDKIIKLFKTHMMECLGEEKPETDEWIDKMGRQKGHGWLVMNCIKEHVEDREVKTHLIRELGKIMLSRSRSVENQCRNQIKKRFEEKIK